MKQIKPTSLNMIVVLAGVLFLQIGLFWSAWYFKNVAVLLLALAIIAVFIAIVFQSSRSVSVPLVSLLLTCMVIESLLPLISPATRSYITPDSDVVRKSFHQAINGLGYRMNPGTYTAKRVTDSGEVLYDVVYEIGKDGYRKAPATADNQLLLFGGSNAFGEGLDANSTLSHHLYAHHGINVKTIAAGGYGLHQALYNIQNGLSAKNSFNILLTAPWHALRGACKKSYSIGTPSYLLDDNLVTLNGVCQGHPLLSRMLGRSNIYKLYDRAFGPGNKLTDEDIALYLATIRTIVEESKQYGSSVLIAFIKAREVQLKDTVWTNELIMEELGQISDFMVDVTLSDKRETLARQYFIHEFDQHPTSKANEERAALIAQVLENSQ